LLPSSSTSLLTLLDLAVRQGTLSPISIIVA